MNDSLPEKVAALPHLPGVYIFSDSSDTIIYVGKAKDLRQRVTSYFNPSGDHSPKVRALVRQIHSLRHIVVDTENDALLLENNLIKQHQPRYNILLKDSKSYPWICISNEAFPRIYSTRRVTRDGSSYFGPYASISIQRTVLELIRGLYPLRSCRHNLSPENIARGKYTVCLEYHIGNCRGGCEGRESPEQYAEYIRHAREILRGEMSPAADFFDTQMREFAAELKFEQAEKTRLKLERLNDYRHRSIIVSPSIRSLDVVSLLTDERTSYCTHIKVSLGAIISSYTFELRNSLDESPGEILGFALGQISGLGREIVVPFEAQGYPDCTVSQRGDKLKLLELAQKNNRLYRLEKLKYIEKTDPERHTDRIMARMKTDLNLSHEPRHIECFDNSNIQGSHPVAACVVFRDGRPAKRDYRHYNIKGVLGPNDFASMEEVVERRYSRLVTEQEPLPQLIVIDGGKGQLSSALAALDRLALRIPVIGLAKRMEEIYFPGDPTPLYLDKNGETLKVLMQIRDEAHRFGITFHRQKRSIALIKSELESVPSLGKVSIDKLLTKYRTIARIKQAAPTELAALVGKARAEQLLAYFSDNPSGS